MMSAMEKNVNFKGTWGKKVRCRFGSNWLQWRKKDYKFWWNVKAVPGFSQLMCWRMLTGVPNKEADIKARSEVE